MSLFTANDTGATGGHQAGFYIGKQAVPLLFDDLGVKCENKDKFIKVKWQNDFTTDSRIIYYGVGSRNEYRITRFGWDFPFLTDDNIVNLHALIQQDIYNYEGYVLASDVEIEYFFDYFALSTSDTNPFPKEYRSQLLSLSSFIEMTKEIEAR